MDKSQDASVPPNPHFGELPPPYPGNDLTPPYLGGNRVHQLAVTPPGKQIKINFIPKYYGIYHSGITCDKKSV